MHESLRRDVEQLVRFKAINCLAERGHWVGELRTPRRPES
jgi:hypothetical protein